jgi:hypothetical protein
VVHQGAGETIQVLAVHLLRKPRECGGTRQVVHGVQGTPRQAQFAQRVVAETVGVIGVCIP